MLPTSKQINKCDGKTRASTGIARKDIAIGLRKIPGVKNCRDSACHGGLEWLDGTDFEFDPETMTDTVEMREYEMCVQFKEDGKLKSFRCGDRSYFACSSECPYKIGMLKYLNII